MILSKRVFLGIALVLVTAHSVLAAPFVVSKTTTLLVAPSSDAPTIATLEPGSVVQVTHQAGAFWRVETPRGNAGYVPADALQQAKTKGGPLIPLMVLAATPLGKIVVAKAVGWFKKLIGMTGDDLDHADGAISVGKELIVLAKEVGGWLKVQDPSGQVGYVKESPDVVYLQPVGYADTQVAGIWKNSAPIPAGATGLTLQVEVRKTDGTPVPPGATLKLGDEYRIYIMPSADCYVRITAETPDAGHACQFFPNQFPGFQTSTPFLAGHTYATEMLPQGVNFKVSEPIGAQDILRIEATTAAPYHYVQSTDGCAPTMTFKGGGFSTAGEIKNPTAQVVVEYPIGTTK